MGRDTEDSLHVFVYSYKNKDIKSVVDNIIDSTSPRGLSITVLDKHPIDHEELLSEYGNVDYIHEFWDEIVNPCKTKQDCIMLNTSSKYHMIMSDDITLKKNWDVELIDFIHNSETPIVISGAGRQTLTHKDKYFFSLNSSYSSSISLSQCIDRNFIISKTETFKAFSYPTSVKYLGEEELLAIEFFVSGIDVYSGPSDIFEDSKTRTLETLYVPFSIEHGYNSLIDIVRNPTYGTARTVSEWLDYHDLNPSAIKKLPYQIDDVAYNPYDLKIIDIGGERFISTIKAIY